MQEERRVAAWIGASVVIEGDVKSSEDMTIAGTVKGNVMVPEHTLVVAAAAKVRGDIIARSALVQGEVTGTITAGQKVEVGENGSVVGDIIAPRMVVAEGAVVHGRVEIARAGAGGGQGALRGTGGAPLFYCFRTGTPGSE